MFGYLSSLSGKHLSHNTEREELNSIRKEVKMLKKKVKKQKISL